MVAAINAGLDRKLFGLAPAPLPAGRSFRFRVEGVPAIAHVWDSGSGKLSITVALWPTADAAHWIKSSNAGFLAGECFAHGWLERLMGRWLQTPSLITTASFQCRSNRRAAVTAIEISPQGYADAGKMML
jgi:hypothetical protein